MCPDLLRAFAAESKPDRKADQVFDRVESKW